MNITTQYTLTSQPAYESLTNALWAVTEYPGPTVDWRTDNIWIFPERSFDDDLDNRIDRLWLGRYEVTRALAAIAATVGDLVSPLDEATKERIIGLVHTVWQQPYRFRRHQGELLKARSKLMVVEDCPDDDLLADGDQVLREAAELERQCMQFMEAPSHWSCLRRRSINRAKEAKRLEISEKARANLRGGLQLLYHEQAQTLIVGYASDCVLKWICEIADLAEHAVEPSGGNSAVGDAVNDLLKKAFRVAGRVAEVAITDVREWPYGADSSKVGHVSSSVSEQIGLLALSYRSVCEAMEQHLVNGMSELSLTCSDPGPGLSLLRSNLQSLDENIQKLERCQPAGMEGLLVENMLFEMEYEYV